MKRPVLVRGARQLLTLRGPDLPRRGSDLRNLGIIQDGAVLIVDGLIREVGPTRRLENLALAHMADEIDASGRILLPGLVDSHTHLVGGHPRLLDYEMSLAGATPDDISQAGGGLPAVVKGLQETSGYTLEGLAARVLSHCIRQGTTTIEAKSGYGVTETGELKILRTHAALNQRYDHMLVSTFFAPIRNSVQAGNYLDWVCGYMLPLIRRRRLASFADVSFEDGSFSLDDMRRYLTTAKDLGLGLKMHAGNNWSPHLAKLAVEAGVVSMGHATFLGPEEINLAAASSIIVTLLPGPSFHLGKANYPPARKLIDRGAAVALASDFNPETSPTNNMQMILSLACNQMNMTPAEAIVASTINAAHALGLSTKVGSIQAGKEADLILLDVADYREIPYYFGVNLVAATLKRGRVIYRTSEVQWTSPT